MSWLQRRVEGEVSSDGTFRANVFETGSGATSEGLRFLARRAGTDEVRRGIEGWAARSLPGVRVEGLDLADGADGPSLRVLLAGRLPGWQDAGKLALVRAGLVPFRGLPSISAPRRRSPVAFPRRTFSAEYRLRLPARLTISELPEPVRLERSFGHYAMTVEEVDGSLVVRQELELMGQTVPVERFDEARDFVRSVLSSSESVVVLKRSG